MDENLPVYIISAAADVLGVHQRTLHLYERKGLIVTVRKGNRRFYSAQDLGWVQSIRYLVHERRINLEGIRQLLAQRAQLAYRDSCEALEPRCETFVKPTAPCWEEGKAQFDCHACQVYNAAIDGLCADQGVPAYVR